MQVYNVELRRIDEETVTCFMALSGIQMVRNPAENTKEGELSCKPSQHPYSEITMFFRTILLYFVIELYVTYVL